MEVQSIDPEIQTYPIETLDCRQTPGPELNMWSRAIAPLTVG